MMHIDEDKGKYVALDDVLARLKENPQELVLSCERAYNDKIEKIASYIGENIKCVNIVLIAGPSSSGKTTTAQKVLQRLLQKGVDGTLVSLDNFYRGVGHYPKNPDGSDDYESIERWMCPKYAIVSKSCLCRAGRISPFLILA